jgi:hypothetical protein
VGYGRAKRAKNTDHAFEAIDDGVKTVSGQE